MSNHAHNEVAHAHGHEGGHGGGHDDAHAHQHHIVSIKTYAIVISILFLLLFVTVYAANFDFAVKLGPAWAPANIIVAILIAFTKMLLIIMFFMHVKYSSRLVQIYVAAGYFFVSVLFAGIFMDFFSRHWLQWWVPLAP